MWGSKGKVWKYLSKRVMVTVYSRIFISLSLNWKIHDKYINNHFSFIITYSAKLLLLKLFLACFHCFSVERFLVVTMILLLPENPSTAESSIKTTVAVVSVKFSLGVASFLISETPGSKGWFSILKVAVESSSSLEVESPTVFHGSKGKVAAVWRILGSLPSGSDPFTSAPFSPTGAGVFVLTSVSFKFDLVSEPL